LPSVPGRRFGDLRPVYALTSRVSFSAAEDFTGILKSRRRATLVGEKTDGGAHPGASYRLHPHFEVFIPVGRTTDPLTGTDWEGAGVAPDIPVPQEQALQVAHALALKSVIESLGGAASRPSAWLLQEARAALQELEAG
jgi:C-terminal processing protease CtpA/Prc